VSGREAKEVRELEAAGWEQRGSGARVTLAYAPGRSLVGPHQACIELRKERFDARVGHAKPEADG
jgi:hypothetical protein